MTRLQDFESIRDELTNLRLQLRQIEKVIEARITYCNAQIHDEEEKETSVGK